MAANQFDKVLEDLTNQHENGVPDLLITVANYLARKTNFFSGGNGGDWKKLVLSIFNREAREAESLKSAKQSAEDNGPENKKMQPESGKVLEGLSSAERSSAVLNATTSTDEGFDSFEAQVKELQDEVNKVPMTISNLDIKEAVQLLVTSEFPQYLWATVAGLENQKIYDFRKNGTGKMKIHIAKVVLVISNDEKLKRKMRNLPLLNKNLAHPRSKPTSNKNNNNE